MNQPAPPTLKPLFDLYRSGAYQTLLEQAQTLLESWPEEPALHSLAGSASLELQDYEAAIRSYRAALALRPELARVHNSLGIACLRSGREQEAAASFHNAVRHDPQFAPAWFNLGITYENRNRLAEAAGYYKQATLLNPVYHQAQCALAQTLWALRIPEQVEERFEKALAIQQDYLPAQLGLLRFLEQSNRRDQLRDALARARKALGEHDAVRLYDGILADIDGAHEQARAQLEAFSIAPADTAGKDMECTRLARLSRICDRLDDRAAALRYAGGANELSRQLSAAKGIDNSVFLQTVANRRRYFTAENINQWPDLSPRAALSRPGADSAETGARIAETETAHPTPSRTRSIATLSDPVFIIGFPRSGTTLLDTLLRGHPRIRVAEEADAAPTLVNRLSGQQDERLQTLARLSDQEVANLRQSYFDALARHLKMDEGCALIDRFALNTVYVGEIHRIFPNAKFILMLRHPADCVLSCFMQTFYETSANASFFTLEDSAHLYAEVFSLWRQYSELLQLNVLQVKYEDLIADPEATCRQLTDFLDLPWHPDLLEHERTARERPLIGTASYAQVIQPLYPEAQGRWQRYRVAMEPVLPLLAPWLSYFDYS